MMRERTINPVVQHVRVYLIIGYDDDSFAPLALKKCLFERIDEFNIFYF